VTTLHPWANGPFELLVHAEGHLLSGDDFDRRIALISFDNAIEVAITTYLTLHPIHRGGRSYPRVDVAKWLDNYHTKLDFLDAEIASRNKTWQVDRGHIIWVHDHRNEQYHGGAKGTPEKLVLKVVRDAALWVFGILFEVDDTEAMLTQAILDLAPQSAPPRVKALDLAIDAQFGVVDVGEQRYYTSDLLFAVDYAAYRDLGTRLCASGDKPTPHTGEQA
jgi:hypothetical protein